MKKILVTTDMSDDSLVAFDVAKELAQAFSAEVTALAIVEDPAELAMLYVLESPDRFSPDIQEKVLREVRTQIEDITQERLSSCSYDCKVIAAENGVDRTITSFAVANAFDCIVMASHGHTGFKKLVLGSVPEKVLRQAPCPVVLVPCSMGQS